MTASQFIGSAFAVPGALLILRGVIGVSGDLVPGRPNYALLILFGMLVQAGPELVSGTAGWLQSLGWHPVLGWAAPGLAAGAAVLAVARAFAGTWHLILPLPGLKAEGR